MEVVSVLVAAATAELPGPGRGAELTLLSVTRSSSEARPAAVPWMPAALCRSGCSPPFSVLSVQQTPLASADCPLCWLPCVIQLGSSQEADLCLKKLKFPEKPVMSPPC